MLVIAFSGVAFMRIVYTFAGNLYGSGMGYIAGWGINRLRAQGHEVTAHNAYYEGGLPRPQWITNHTLITRFANSLRRAAGAMNIRMPPDFNPAVRYRVFDWIMAQQLPAGDAVYSWTTFCCNTFRVAKKRGMRRVLENPASHRLAWEELVNQERERLGIPGKATSARVRERALEEYELAHAIIVPSRFAHDSFVSNGVDPEKVRQYHYGVDCERFSPGQEHERAGAFRVIFAGEIGVRKGALYLLRAWDELKLPKAELLLLGKVEPEWELLARDLLQLSGVRRIGFDPRSERWYRQASLLVLPSIEDGFGLVVLEAMASGCPVIVSSHTGACDLVEDGVNGWVVEPGDSRAIAAHMEECFRDRDLLQHMAGNARRTAVKATWDRYAAGVAEALSNTQCE